MIISKRKQKQLAMRIACAMLIGTCVAGWDCNPVWAATGAVNGTSVTISGPDASAFGNQTTASGEKATAFGHQTTASGEKATAFGFSTKAISYAATAFGEGTTASGGNATAFGEKTTADGNRSTAFGNQTTASGDSATAFGFSTKASGFLATAFGDQTKAGGSNAVAFGYQTMASGDRTTAFGWETTASGENATAFGFSTKASGDSATAFGILSQALAANSLAALGGTTATEATNAAAIGQGATASLADSVALGSGSVANRAAGVKGTYFAAPNPEDSENAAWKSTQAAIAVGSDEGETRQIIGVAAGSKPTDAVNVAQLQNAFDALGGLDLTDLKLRVNNLDSKVNKAGAGAAALAALHPLDMDNKFDVSAAFGSYHDANALALGVFYRPTDNVMFSAGGSIGNGENMVNVGVTFALDKGQGVRVSKTAMAKKINALTDENAAMKQEIGALKAALARLEAKMK